MSQFRDSFHNGLQKVDCSILKNGQDNMVRHTELVDQIQDVVTKEDMRYTHECLAATWEKRKSGKRKSPMPQPPLQRIMQHAPTLETIPTFTNTVNTAGNYRPIPARLFPLNEEGLPQGWATLRPAFLGGL
jgi:hypothetical protein